ncbi:MAG: single-stranded DNA-binding protein [Planctomycetota bacterium]
MSVTLIRIVRDLSRAVDRLRFAPPVTHVYNPLAYAREPLEQYLERYGHARGGALLLGMNPGPFGMAQTGVPFGEVSLVREWLGIEGRVKPPRDQHPKRPIEGFDCQRSEVSGRRLWGWAQERFEKPEAFFEHYFIWNYCPLAFLEESGRNRTPDKLPAAERDSLHEICDRALMRVAKELEPRIVIGVGKFAEKRALMALTGLDLEFGSILHPSPASPAANKGWAPVVEKQLKELGCPV